MSGTYRWLRFYCTWNHFNSTITSEIYWNNQFTLTFTLLKRTQVKSPIYDITRDYTPRSSSWPSYLGKCSAWIRNEWRLLVYVLISGVPTDGRKERTPFRLSWPLIFWLVAHALFKARQRALKSLGKLCAAGVNESPGFSLNSLKISHIGKKAKKKRYFR